VGNRGHQSLPRPLPEVPQTALLSLRITIPVWAVGGDINAQKVMLAVDGSESSLVAVDYASFMFSGNTSLILPSCMLHPGSGITAPLILKRIAT
jgi:hypothetical protein